MGCSGHKAVHVPTAELPESVACGRAKTMKTVSSTDISPKSIGSDPDPVPASIPSSYSVATCRSELMNLHELLHKEKTGESLDKVKNRMHSVVSSAKTAKNHADYDSSHLTLGCTVAVNNTGRRGIVLALCDAGRCMVRLEGREDGVQVKVKDLQVLPESLKGFHITFSLPLSSRK